MTKLSTGGGSPESPSIELPGKCMIIIQQELSYNNKTPLDKSPSLS